MFSDKTGTLTQNVMDFKRFSAGPISYGKKNPNVNKDKLKEQSITNVNFEDDSVFEQLQDPTHQNFEYL